jgi:hypothetical protein
VRCLEGSQACQQAPSRGEQHNGMSQQYAGVTRQHVHQFHQPSLKLGVESAVLFADIAVELRTPWNVTVSVAVPYHCHRWYGMYNGCVGTSGMVCRKCKCGVAVLWQCSAYWLATHCHKRQQGKRMNITTRPLSRTLRALTLDGAMLGTGRPAILLNPLPEVLAHIRPADRQGTMAVGVNPSRCLCDCMQEQRHP